MDLYLQISWSDASLKHNGSVKDLTEREMADMWIPLLYFPNSRVARYHDVLRKNAAMRIETNGTVSYSVRQASSVHFYLFTLVCNHSLHKSNLT